MLRVNYAVTPPKPSVMAMFSPVTGFNTGYGQRAPYQNWDDEIGKSL